MNGKIAAMAAEAPIRADEAARPAAFLDRDGVINVDRGYTFRPDQLVPSPTAAAGIRLLSEAGYLVIVVPKQSGIARGRCSEEDVHGFHAHLAEVLAAEDERTDALYHAPYHPEGRVPGFAIDHDDRKPGAGMLLKAMREWPIRRAGSFLIGDKSSDVDAAAGAGAPACLIPSNTGDLLATAREMLAVHQGD